MHRMNHKSKNGSFVSLHIYHTEDGALSAFKQKKTLATLNHSMQETIILIDFAFLSTKEQPGTTVTVLTAINVISHGNGNICSFKNKQYCLAKYLSNKRDHRFYKKQFN